MSATETREMICIGCPLGCPLVVEVRDNRAWQIKGYGCRKGKTYAEEEVSDPRRTLTTTVALLGGPWPRLPVRTATSVPKDDVIAVCRAIHALTVTAPVRAGDVLLPDVCGTDVPVIATRSVGAVD